MYSLHMKIFMFSGMNLVYYNVYSNYKFKQLEIIGLAYDMVKSINRVSKLYLM